MKTPPTGHLFLLGKDYHLGDLLWFTAVLAAYRRQVRPDCLLVACPDRPISRILERHPLIDELLFYDEARSVVDEVRVRFARHLAIHDLRPLPLALSMLRAWRYRRPWLYLRDLWLGERGQWLATLLRLGHMEKTRPVLHLDDGDRATARTLSGPYVVLAPRGGEYTNPLYRLFWHHMKGWSEECWEGVAAAVRDAGYEPITLAAAGQAPIGGTRPLIGLPIRQAAGVIEQAAALVTMESGLWYVAAALERPFVIVPWWLPRTVDWAASMGVPHSLVPRDQASVQNVMSQVRRLLPAT